MQYRRTLVLVSALAFTTACESFTGPDQPDQLLMEEAFATMLVGFENAFSSFEPGAAGGVSPWIPSISNSRGVAGHGGGRQHAPAVVQRQSGSAQTLMGGGLAGAFHGGAHDRGFLLPSSCTFQAASGRVECPTETRNGLTINRSAAYYAADGTVQQAFDRRSTNAANLRVTVSGTLVRRDSSTTTVQHASDRTISGLAAGSTQRTINSVSAGTESTSGRNRRGQEFTAQRVLADTVSNVVIPVRTDSVPTYPVSGTITRSMRATVTVAGGTPVTRTRREVITYNGSNTATLVITQDDQTRTCTLPLPRGRPVCQ